MNTPKIIILAGPTAVGKTALSIAVAKHFNCEIISADSQQVYKGMDIGTAKITPEEMQGIKHHMIDVAEVNESMDLALFSTMCRNKIEQIQKSGKNVLITGGSGLYIDGIVYKSYTFDTPGKNNDFREKMNALAKKYSKEYVYDLLKQKDPVRAKEIHPNNLQRVIRALEATQTKPEKDKPQKAGSLLENSFYFVLNMPREQLYERINERVEKMFEQGLLEEVIGLLDKGFAKNEMAFKAIGYKEIIEYLDGNISLEEAKEKIKTNSRHFAKRQLTWFRGNEDVIWINKDEMQDDKEIIQYMEKKIWA